MPKSRYSALVKLKKRALDSAEQALVAANNRCSSISSKLHNLYEELYAMTLPTSGTAGELLYTNSLIRAQKQNIAHHQHLLEDAKIAQEKERELFTKARVEHEKFNYLELQEIEQWIKEQKIAESKMLDEVGILIHKKGEK